MSWTSLARRQAQPSALHLHLHLNQSLRQPQTLGTAWTLTLVFQAVPKQKPKVSGPIKAALTQSMAGIKIETKTD